INVVTGVVVSGLSNNDRGHISALGLDVAVAVVVAFTISLELTLLVTRSVLSPVRDLLKVTERVRTGDLSARAPVMSGDEMGRLAQSFNAMLTGLQERERLHEAFGSYVAPDVAERVLAEGTMLEGEVVAGCAIARATGRRYGGGLGLGIGINAGPVSAGTVGGGGRLEFAVVGDAVNVAGRVGRATREMGDRVLLTEATRGLLTRDSIP